MKKVTIILAVLICMFFVNPLMAKNIQQSGASNANLDAYSSIYMEGSEGKRNTPNSVLPGFPQGPSYFSDVPMTHEYIGIVDLAKINPVWSKSDFRQWSKNKEDYFDVNVEERITYNYYDPMDKMKITFINPAQNNMVEFVGIIQANAKKNTTTEAVFSILGQKCLENGANLMYPINEGAKRVLGSSAWGVTAGYVHVEIGGNNESTAGSGVSGIGYSKGETSYRHEPFIRVAVYRVRNNDVFDSYPVFPENNGNKLKEENQKLREQIKHMEQMVDQYQKENY